MAVQNSLWSFGIFFQIWHVRAKKNLASLLQTNNQAIAPLSQM
jgi:hypothetical protein